MAGGLDYVTRVTDCPSFDKQLISSNAPNTHCYEEVIANDNMT